MTTCPIRLTLATIFLGDIIAACLVRSLYPYLAETVDLFPDLNYSVACILTLVGLDMCAGSAGHEFPKSLSHNDISSKRMERRPDPIDC